MKVRITFTPNNWAPRDFSERDQLAAAVCLVPGFVRQLPSPEVIQGEVLHIGSTVIETGCQGAEFFAVPCLVVDTGDSIKHVPLREHARNVHVAKLCDGEERARIPNPQTRRKT